MLALLENLEAGNKLLAATIMLAVLGIFSLMHTIWRPRDLIAVVVSWVVAGVTAVSAFVVSFTTYFRWGFYVGPGNPVGLDLMDSAVLQMYFCLGVGLLMMIAAVFASLNFIMANKAEC